MIVELTKYDIIALAHEREIVLRKLASSSMLHVSEFQSSDNLTLKELSEELTTLESALFECKKYVTNPLKTDFILDYKGFINNISEYEHLDFELSSVEKELSQYSEWGKPDWNKLYQIIKGGCQIGFYKISTKDYHNLNASKSQAIELQRKAGIVNFIIDNTFASSEINEFEVSINIENLAFLYNEAKKLRTKLLNKETELIEQSNEIYNSLVEAINKKKQKYELIKKVHYHSKSALNNEIVLIEAWCDRNTQSSVDKLLDKLNLVYTKNKPLIDDKPPILLKNNKFIRLFEPIVELFALPNYNELDLTPFLTPFFLLFFGLCIGDAGYGLIIIIASFIFNSKIPAQYKVMLHLIRILSISTVLMGTITGTLFGIELAKIDFLDNYKQLFMDSDKIFSLSLILGGVQIFFGLIVKTINLAVQNGIRYSISTIGWILLVASVLLQFSFQCESCVYVLIINKIVLVVAIALILLFNSPSKSLISNLGSGVWDIYTTITGIFGDLLSYIRLFALSVASGILGLVINQIAIEFGKMSYIGPILFFIIIVLGHSLNLMIALLGAFVHSMRLTFVEFYKNAGFTGGGKKFKVFNM